MVFTAPTISEFKDYFVRDFPFGTDIETQILDADIEKAIDKTSILINKKFLPSQELYTLGYQLLTAHHLVMALRQSSQGLAGGFQFLQNSRSVDGISESVTIPDWIIKRPTFSKFVTTSYGGEYLMIILPFLVGNVFVTKGYTTP